MPSVDGRIEAKPVTEPEGRGHTAHAERGRAVEEAKPVTEPEGRGHTAHAMRGRKD